MSLIVINRPENIIDLVSLDSLVCFVGFGGLQWKQQKQLYGERTLYQSTSIMHLFFSDFNSILMIFVVEILMRRLRFQSFVRHCRFSRFTLYMKEDGTSS